MVLCAPICFYLLPICMIHRCLEPVCIVKKMLLLSVVCSIRVKRMYGDTDACSVCKCYMDEIVANDFVGKCKLIMAYNDLMSFFTFIWGISPFPSIYYVLRNTNACWWLQVLHSCLHSKHAWLLHHRCNVTGQMRAAEYVAPRLLPHRRAPCSLLYSGKSSWRTVSSIFCNAIPLISLYNLFRIHLCSRSLILSFSALRFRTS